MHIEHLFSFYLEMVVDTYIRIVLFNFAIIFFFLHANHSPSVYSTRIYRKIHHLFRRRMMPEFFFTLVVAVSLFATTCLRNNIETFSEAFCHVKFYFAMHIEGYSRYTHINTAL